MSMLPKFDPFSENMKSANTAAKVAKVAKVWPENPQNPERLAGLATLAGHIPENEEFEERAAIIEFGVGVPREWAEGFALLCTMPRHPDYRNHDWQQLIDDAGYFLDQWAVQIAALGWSVQEVFGVSPGKPYDRLDMHGLVPALCGKVVVAVSADSVTVQTKSGARQRIFRHSDDQRPGRVPLWEVDHP